MNTTAATQEMSSAITTTWKIERVYSAGVRRAVASVHNLAAVTSVPESIGNAVPSYAAAAARTRS